MRKEVRRWVRECQVCQKCKTENVASPGLLQPLSVPEKVWQDISMDFIEGLPKSQGRDMIMVVVDRLSKYGYFIALSHLFTALTVAQLFMENVYKLHGMPSTIVSDRDKVFTSHFWKELFKLQGTKLNLTTAYHPQSDGQTEVLNKCLGIYLRCMCSEIPREWRQWLHLAEW